jgi:hypothetical protein
LHLQLNESPRRVPTLQLYHLDQQHSSSADGYTVSQCAPHQLGFYSS